MKAITKATRNRLILLAVAVALFLVYLFVPPVNAFVNRAAAVLGSGKIETVIEYIRSYGTQAMIISAFLMVFSSVVAPLPAFMITLSNAAIFGWWQGAILSWSSAMAGAALCFFLSRILGRDVVEKLAGRTALAGVESYFEKYGTKTILVCRLLPFVSFDAVSYFAGLTSMKFWPFFIATGIAQTPATIVYSYVGGTLTGGVRMLFIGLLCLFSISILIGIIKTIYTDRQKKANAAAAENTEAAG